MCIDCVSKLSRAFSFRKQCWEADTLLRAEEQDEPDFEDFIIKKEEIVDDKELGEFIVMDNSNNQDYSENYDLDATKIEIEEYYINDLVNDEMKTEFLEIEMDHETEDKIEDLNSNETSTSKKLKVQTVNGEYLCSECGLVLDTIQKYRNHFRYHHDKESMEKHKQKSIGEWECTICDKQFTKIQLYRRHMRLHDPTNPNKCEICNQTFIAPSILENHMYTHTGKTFL